MFELIQTLDLFISLESQPGISKDGEKEKLTIRVMHSSTLLDFVFSGPLVLAGS